MAAVLVLSPLLSLAQSEDASEEGPGAAVLDSSVSSPQFVALEELPSEEGLPNSPSAAVSVPKVSTTSTAENTPAALPVLLDEAPVEEEKAKEEPLEKTDHQRVVGRFAVGYMGRQTLHYGTAYAPVVAPIIGVRYYVTPLWGIDAGIGLNMLGGKAKETGSADVKAAGHIAALFHVGAPLSLASSRHFSFQVVPEMNLGFAKTGDQDPDPDVKESHHGSFFNVGAKVGAEIQFGFMDLPELSLQGNVGLYFQTETVKDKESGPTETIASDSYSSLGTTLSADPWDIFTSSVSALYYF